MEMFREESWSSILPTTCIVLVSISVFILLQKWKTRSNDRNSKKYLNCTNPNCVRCSTYSEVLLSAQIKMSQFIAINKLKEDDPCVLRIKSSLNKAHSPLESASSPTDQKPEVFSLDNLKTSPWWDNDKDVDNEIWKDIIFLEENYQRILEEMLFIWKNKASLWINNSTPNGRWSVFHLINQGKINNEKTKLCPTTYCCVLKMKSLMRNNVFGNVAFSAIEPSTRISKHHGPTNIRLRCHLGLITPSCCELEVAGVSRTWSRGKCLLFDDSYLHGVSHGGSKTGDIRAVLMVDLWHPAISREEKQAIDYVFAPR